VTNKFGWEVRQEIAVKRGGGSGRGSLVLSASSKVSIEGGGGGGRGSSLGLGEEGGGRCGLRLAGTRRLEAVRHLDGGGVVTT
jgi:hypothetical protein